MLYQTFIYKAKELTVHQLDNGTWYLEPEWQDILYRENLGALDDLEDSYLSGWYDVEDILKLEVEKRNAQNSKTKEVVQWVYDVITATLEPAMLQEENELVKNVVEYMQAKNNQTEEIVPKPKEMK